jgi:hypothetical protein
MPEAATMNKHVVLLSIPGLRHRDLALMPKLSGRLAGGSAAKLTPSFPCLTWPVQTNILTGKLPREHGVVANGFYWREERKVEMWTAGNEKIESPQIWDLLHQKDESLTSAVWFPMLGKRCNADYVCMPAPVHNPDGSESLWCYTTPTELYGELKHRLGHFPLQHFWGPAANKKSAAWICDSAVYAAKQYCPRFFYLYLPHLDYAAQRTGPDSEPAIAAVRELDDLLDKLADGFQSAYGDAEIVWIVASEYVITPVDHVVYPNRLLREVGLLKTKTVGGGEQIDFEASYAWALADHQMSHVFIRDADDDTVREVVRIFAETEGVSEVLAGPGREKYGLDHERSGEVILVSEPNSWQAYYYWNDDEMAPAFARTVDIHRKPGYDPVELHFDPQTKSIPLDANLVMGSHGAPVAREDQKGVLLVSDADMLGDQKEFSDTDVAGLVLEQFS